MRSRLKIRRGTLAAGAVLASALLVSIAGSFVTYRAVANAFAQHLAVDRAREQIADVFSLQLDEETGVRGFLASGQKLYLAPYNEARPQFDPAMHRLQDAVLSSSLSNAMPVIVDLYQAHANWERLVAAPSIANPTSPLVPRRLVVGKALMDRMRGDVAQLTSLIGQQSDAASKTIRTLLLDAALLTALFILLFGLAAIVADYVRSRALEELERERSLANTVQNIFIAGWDSVPDLSIGTAYVSATLEASLGGDLFDVQRIDDDRTMLLVADISGKGLAAAMETALVKYSLRLLAHEDMDPGSVLQKFNRTFAGTSSDPSSFVSVFVAILHHGTRSLRFANAGHGPVYVRREDRVEQLPVTGPLIGVGGEGTFASASITLGANDTLVLATDGLTEARDASGMMLEDERAMRWIQEGSSDPQTLANEIVARLARYAGGRIADDLALLVVQWAPGAAATAQPAEQPAANTAGAPSTAPTTEPEPAASTR